MGNPPRKFCKCVVPENIHTFPTEGHRNSEGWWGVKANISEGEGGFTNIPLSGGF